MRSLALLHTLLLLSLVLPVAVQAQDVQPTIQKTLASWSSWTPYAPPDVPDTLAWQWTPDEARHLGLVPPARWLSLDPLAEKHPDWTPYNYVLANPLILVDPDGRQVAAHIYQNTRIHQKTGIRLPRPDPIMNLTTAGAISRTGIEIGADTPGDAFELITGHTVTGRTGNRLTAGIALLVPGLSSGVLRTVFRSGTDRLVPFGFKGADEFGEFSSDLLTGLEKAGVGDATILFQGSAATGKSFKDGATLIRDFDVAVASGSLFEKAKSLGINLRGGGIRTGPLREADLEKLGLTELVRQLSEQAGRPVNIMIFEFAGDAARRSPSIGVK